MRIHKLPLAVALCSTVLFASNALAEDKLELKDLNQKASYAIGLDIGRTWKQREANLSLDALTQGIKDALAGSSTLLTEQEARDAVRTLNDELRTKFNEKRKVLGEKAKTEGEAFLAENKNKQGIVTLSSGLQYKVITDGAGKTPDTSDMVTVHYRGTLVDGTEFDSSYKRGQPATFGTTGVIAGWTEALLKMKEGSKWQLFIPSELAYKEQGRGLQIPPNSVLIFDVELISVQSREPQAAQPLTSQPVTSDIIKVPSAEGLKKGEKIEIIKDPNAAK